jgi:MFS family permease
VSWDPKDNVINGAVSDTVSGEADRGRAFAFIVALNSVGMVVGFMASFFCLRMHLENYLVPWLLFAAIAMGIFGFLVLGMPETYPAQLRKPVTTSMLNPLSSHWRNLSLISHDRVLVGLTGLHFLLLFHFVGFITQGFSYLMLMGFSMEEAVLPGVVDSLAQVAWSGVVVFALPKLGASTCYIGGHAMFVVAYFFWGPYTVMVGRSGPYIGNVVQGAAFAFIIPSMQAIVSQRVEKDNQSKSFAAISTVSTVGIMLGMACYSGVIFSGTATGMMRALPAIVSASVALLCTVLAAALFLAVPAGVHTDKSCSEPSKHRSGP